MQVVSVTRAVGMLWRTFVFMVARTFCSCLFPETGWGRCACSRHHTYRYAHLPSCYQRCKVTLCVHPSPTKMGAFSYLRSSRFGSTFAGVFLIAVPTRAAARRHLSVL